MFLKEFFFQNENSKVLMTCYCGWRELIAPHHSKQLNPEEISFLLRR
jgi:hypothetical protein